MEGGFYEWACFVAQQAPAKALKAVCHRLGAEAWDHSVLHLIGGLQEKVAVPPSERECGRVLDLSHPAGGPPCPRLCGRGLTVL
ncbi:MAG: HEPN domain-containing protein [Dehalococcoidia bacterium]|nr:HEPN domain-containing protein [Dehalococcoidia bacterium]MDW8120566.1 HEPN domain-containing protein [Chloroflexota bacterium]